MFGCGPAEDFVMQFRGSPHRIASGLLGEARGYLEYPNATSEKGDAAEWFWNPESNHRGVYPVLGLAEERTPTGTTFGNRCG